MKTLIIPDMHCQFAEAEAIISEVKPDQTIFLGDYFDRYDSDPQIPYNVARWLKNSINIPDRIHLLGNHELFYVTNNYGLICSGNTELKYNIIKSQSIPWNMTYLHYWLDEWLITHAGLSNKYYQLHKSDYDKYTDHNTSPSKFIHNESARAKLELMNGNNHRLFSVSELRGGNDPVSGTLWCDFREFERIDGIKQLFGHTHFEKPYVSEDGNTICLDAEGYYAIYEDKKMTIHKSLN